MNVKNNLKKTLKTLTGLNGGSGQEQHVIREILTLLKSNADEIEVDVLGNIIARKNGYQNGKKMLVMSHMDEVGLVVKNILDSGFILFDKVGGVPEPLLQGRKVSVGKGAIPGVIGSKPGHLQTSEELKKVKTVEECYIDVGAFSKQEVLDMGIDIGDQIIWQSDFMEFKNPDLISTKSIDDRVGCTVLLELFKNLKREDFTGQFIGIFSVREEVGLYGALSVQEKCQADLAIVLDTIPAGDTPDVDSVKELPVALGKGPVLSITDGVQGQFFSNFHPAIKKLVTDLAQTKNIALQKAVILSGGYTTDNSRLAYVNNQMATATIAIPRRYSHSPIETAHMDDIVNTYLLLHSIAKNKDQIEFDFLNE
ncbi:M42 family metallopeptidase [Listeria sp. PSOL-1]|uniref:M42 family metallopeptidase n=1 Tax=Listeria sp. PSOL-1 TaxID=1844999 RepID=UPI0013D59788|nr:M42 family metallopeptidase [Listeria sp. PSOL-1]